MKELQRTLLDAFQSEHKDHLEAARRMLDDLETAGWRLESIDLVELHRRLHSLKGAARAVDLRPIEGLAHRLETVIASCQKGRVVLDAAVAETLRAAFDAIEDSVAAIDADGQVALPAEIVTQVETLAASEVEGAPPPHASPADSPAGSGRETGPTSARRGKQDQETVRPPPPIAGNLRVDAGSLDALFESSAEILTATMVQHRLGADFLALEEEIREVQNAIDALRRLETDRSGIGGRGTLHAARMRHLQALESWIRRYEGYVSAFGQQQRAHGWRLRHLGRRLEGQVRRLRLVPADTVFGGMRKMVRDLGMDQGKAIRVDVRGLDTLADRAVLQALRDSVIHVLRNAVTHGIETRDDRLAHGKAAEGRVLLEVAARGGRLVVRVEDDGRGIDLERVRHAALARGLSAIDDAQASDPKVLAALLSEPGLSTVETVNELAGRGIGLSVVAAAVDRMLGEFTIRSNTGNGTTVTLSVPVSVSSTRLVMVRCRNDLYGIPVHGVERLHRVPRERIESVDGWPVARLDDAGPLRLVSLAHLLGDRNDASAEEPILPVIVLRWRGVRLGAAVDGLIEVRDGVVRDLRTAVGGLAAGSVVTDMGTVVPVLDVQALIEAAAGTSAHHPMLDTKPEVATTAPSILVVDDSITTRTLEKSILEANGFRVRLSVDGVDALEQLRDHPADLVISDIEMPRMNGFELLRAMKRDAAFATIPVVLVTSRSSDEDRRRGLSLGADAYVVKQRFDQTDLLTTIGQLL